jgi:uncharacterized protein (DUF1684 family)
MMKRSLLFLGLLMAMGCKPAEQPSTTASTTSDAKPTAGGSYEQSILKWRADRRTRLTSDTGWLSLVGLDWLSEGENTLGSAKGAVVPLPAKLPADAGKLVLHGGRVTLLPSPAGGLTVDGKPVTAPLALIDDTDPKGPTVVASGTVHFNIIKRNERIGVRVKDSESEARAKFIGLDYFPTDPKWRVEARFVPFNPPRHVAITNVLGMVSDEVSPGSLVFTVDGKEYRVDPILEQGETDYFLIFKDATSGKETYGAARYVYAPPPGPDGKTILDFNKAYNPPCAFTPYATCPLPPPQNRLPMRIEAGEKKYALGHA